MDIKYVINFHAFPVNVIRALKKLPDYTTLLKVLNKNYINKEACTQIRKKGL